MIDHHEETPLLIGDVAVFRLSNGRAVIHDGVDGLMRVRVPAPDRVAVAAALLPPDYVVAPREGDTACANSTLI